MRVFWIKAFEVNIELDTDLILYSEVMPHVGDFIIDCGCRYEIKELVEPQTLRELVDKSMELRNKYSLSEWTKVTVERDAATLCLADMMGFYE